MSDAQQEDWTKKNEMILPCGCTANRKERQHIIINIFKPSRWILDVFLMYLTRYSASIFDTVTIIYMILYIVTCTNIVTPPLAFSTFKKKGLLPRFVHFTLFGNG